MFSPLFRLRGDLSGVVVQEVVQTHGIRNPLTASQPPVSPRFAGARIVPSSFEVGAPVVFHGLSTLSDLCRFYGCPFGNHRQGRLSGDFGSADAYRTRPSRDGHRIVSKNSVAGAGRIC
jgi:hypothetical protein